MKKHIYSRIGIDQSDEAIRITENRLAEMENDLFSVNTKYQLLKTKQTNSVYA